MVKRCLATPWLVADVSLSFLDRTESDRFLKGYRHSANAHVATRCEGYMKLGLHT